MRRDDVAWQAHLAVFMAEQMFDREFGPVEGTTRGFHVTVLTIHWGNGSKLRGGVGTARAEKDLIAIVRRGNHAALADPAGNGYPLDLSRPADASAHTDALSGRPVRVSDWITSKKDA